jgi:hypothetical protein
MPVAEGYPSGPSRRRELRQAAAGAVVKAVAAAAVQAVAAK